MLDTNMVSYIIKGKPVEAREKLIIQPIESIVISVVTEAELLYGIARKGSPASLSLLVKDFLIRVQILPWESDTAKVYAELRASCSASGIVISALDMMIAAHAISSNSTLVTHDKAFSLIPNKVLTIEDWIQ